jgi:hypothetical protein
MSVRLSVHLEQLVPHWSDFYETLRMNDFRKCLENVNFHSNMTSITGTLHEDQYTFLSYLSQFFLE